MAMNATDDKDAIDYTPTSSNLPGAPPDVRPGLALALSGGGFRAALFHLGALRSLNEHGVLSRVSTISSVSGGSILSAHLAARVVPWPEPGAVHPDWEMSVARPFREFTKRNLRTWPIVRRYLPPWNIFRGGVQANTLAARYRLLNAAKLSELPVIPRFVFCATDLVFGVNWIFERDRVGDYEAGYGEPGNLTVADAVAASSSFPPVFQPVPIGRRVQLTRVGRFPRGPRRDHYLRRLSLTDGGVYDNMGLEPVWLSHGVVLVSDGGAVFSFQSNRTPLRRLIRYSGILGDQAGRLRRRWLMTRFNQRTLYGAFWSISSLVDHYDPGAEGYSSDVTRNFISRVRTDMDSFTDSEIKILENHGYLLADVAVRNHLPWLVRKTSLPSPPHPEWMRASQAKRALEQSGRRKWLGRF
jgi:NTE family protein